MPNVNKHERFPRRALARRVSQIMQELEGWRKHYYRLTRDGDSPAIALKAAERAETCDNLWHTLEGVATELRVMS